MSLDIAVLLDSKFLQKWEYKALAHLLENPKINANLSKVIINEESSTDSKLESVKGFSQDLSLWKILVALRVAKSWAKEPPWYRQKIPLDNAFDTSALAVQFSNPQPAEDFGNLLPAKTVSALSEVDVAIRFGFGILKGDALTAPTHGVLSYHHGDLTKYRGPPSGFYEFIHHQSMAGVTVQRLSENIDAGAIAASAQVDISDANSLEEVHSKLFTASEPLLSESVQQIESDEPLKKPEKLGTLYTTPAAGETLYYLWLRLRSLLSYR